MIILRCTKKLLKLSKLDADPLIPASSAPLPEWYANVISLTYPGKNAVLYTHNPSRLSVLTRGRNINTTIGEFQTRLIELLRRLGAHEQLLDAQQDAMQKSHICKTDSRSMLGTMNEMVYHIQHRAREAGRAENLKLNRVEDELSQYLFSSKEMGKGYFTPHEYLKGNNFVNLN